MRSLIVNADDLGWTEGVNRGIAEAHRNGIVTSASLLANGAAFESGVELAQTTPGLGIGVHLNLSDGEPVAQRELVTTLLNDSGELEGRPESLLIRLARRSVLLEEVEREWDAQIQKVRDFGVEPTHLDGHVLRLVEILPEGTTELMCHPGYVDAQLTKSATRLQASRQAELEILTDTGIRNLVASQGIRLIDYGFAAQEA